MKVTKGQIVMLERGEYSGYTAGPVVRALKDHDLCEEVQQYVRDWSPPNKWSILPNEDNVINWLTIYSGLYEEVDCTPIHLGAYGDLNDSFLPEDKRGGYNGYCG